MKKILFLATLVATTFASPAFSETTKQARQNDLVDSYTLSDNGVLRRQIGSLSCDVTNNVQSFKVSQHPNDVAMIYYTRRENGVNNLYLLRYPAGTARVAGQCPKADKVKLMDDVKEYTVVSSQKTEIVNMALSRSGNLLAWGNSGPPLLSMNGISDLEMNPCNDKAGFSFKRYVAFAKTFDGKVLKIEGDKPNDSKFTPENFASIDDFQKQNKVCQSQQASLVEPAAVTQEAI